MRFKRHVFLQGPAHEVDLAYDISRFAFADSGSNYYADFLELGDYWPVKIWKPAIA